MLYKIVDLKKYIDLFKFDEVVTIEKLNIKADTLDITEVIKKEIKTKEAKNGNIEAKREVINGLNYIVIYENSKKIGLLDIIGFYMIKFNIIIQFNAIQKIAKDFNIKHKEAEYYMNQKDAFLNNIDVISSIEDVKWEFPYLYRKIKKEIMFYNTLNTIAINMITKSKHSYNEQQVLRLSKRMLGKYFMNHSDLKIKESSILRSLNYLVLLGFLDKLNEWDIPEDMLSYELRNKKGEKNLTSYYIIKPLTIDLMKEIEKNSKMLEKHRITKTNITSETIREKLGTYHFNRLYLNTKDNINAVKLSKELIKEKTEADISKYEQYMPF